MQYFFLDVVEETFIRRHSRDIIILVIMVLVATAAIIGVFVWRKKQKTTK
jgi:uncharacterized PurR-regulated membrane protein YhhQ (DUF165 family)